MNSRHIVDLCCGVGERLAYGKINLVQIGRLVCGGGFRISPHTHLDWFELTYVVEGEGTVCGADEQISVRKGDCFLSFPCEKHAVISSEESPLTFDHFAFSTDNAEYKQVLECLMANYISPEKRLFRSYRIKELLDGCITELLADGDYEKDFLTASFSLVVLELFRIFDVNRDASYVNMGGVQSPEMLCGQIKHYIDTHLFSMDGLTVLSSVFGYNYSYLSFLFKKMTGETLSGYYNNRRFESAKLMISENRLKISEISNLLGYNSVYAFSKAFKDMFGVSPKNYFKGLF